MKFIINKNNLSAAVNNLSRAVATKSAIPVLEGIFIKAGKDTLTLTAYNLELSMTKTEHCRVVKEGSVVINAKLLGEILRRLSSDEVVLECDDKLMCHITCGSAKFDIMGMAAADYPEIPEQPDSADIVIDGEQLKRLVRQTGFAVAQIEGTRPILTGINVSVENGLLKFVAIDGYRLAIRQEPIKCEQEFNIVVSSKAITDAVKILSDEEEQVNLRISKRNISFEINGYVLISRLLEGEFVDYKKVIPQTFMQTIELSTRQFIDIIERISLIISDNFSTPLRCMFKEGEVMFTSASSVGRATETAEINLQGPDFEIGLNNRYLLDALRACETDTVSVKFNGGSSAVIIKPLKGDDFIYMVMPMKLK
ncbi:MAG: DNA polymerase III subunit beta [Clostridia bacterium]|nr:DNA polymerase III subunit beta [Clostridia bacterium]